METGSLILCIFAMLPSIKANCSWLAQQSVSSINLYSSQNTLGVSDIEFLRQWQPEKYLSWEWNLRALPKLQLPCLSLTSFQSLNPFCTSHYTLQHFFQESAHNSRNPTPQGGNDKSKFLLARQEPTLKLWASIHKPGKGYRKDQCFPRKSNINAWFG